MGFVFSAGPLPGLVFIQPTVFSDDRGAFFEVYKQSHYASAGITDPFVQENHSISRQGSLRGIHFQADPHAQGKLVRVISGAVWDVAVDLRPESPEYGRWFGCELSAENRTQVYLPPGYGHGVLTLSGTAEVVYLCTAEYHPDREGGVRWDDPTLGVAWPLEGLVPVLSARDQRLPWFTERFR